MAPQLDSHNEDAHNACISAFQLAFLPVLSFTLKAAVELGVFDIIAHGGPGAQLSASEITAQLPTCSSLAPAMLDRVLHLLSSFSVISCSYSGHPAEGRPMVGLYGLLPVSSYLVRGQDGSSLAPLLLAVQEKPYAAALCNLKDAVLEGGVAFDMVHGIKAYQYPATDAKLNTIFNEAMSGPTNVVMKKVLETYEGCEGIKDLVDVGGGVGDTLKLIKSKYPQIQAINFELPHVVSSAPAYPGIEHVEGDMFVSVPKAEAILMKSILHNWGDEMCLKLLKNCFDSLPEHGKVIVIDSVAPETHETNATSNTILAADVLMMALCHGGKERTFKEFEAMAKEAGFAGIKAVCNVCIFTVMEFYKNAH